jgi:hypothetical protein
MKTGTKCRLKYMPEIEVFYNYMMNDKITEVRFDNGICFPVPLSELEPVQEWPKTWDELGEEIAGSFIYHADSDILSGEFNLCSENKNIFATHQQAEAALAMAQLSQLHKAIVGDWEADWDDDQQGKYIVCRFRGELTIRKNLHTFNHFPFETCEQAEFSLLHHRELWEKFYMIKK